MISTNHTIIVPLSRGYMVYEETLGRVWSNEIQAWIHPSRYIKTIDYSEVCDACIDDLKEGRYL
jgi:hypothetical protein